MIPIIARLQSTGLLDYPALSLEQLAPAMRQAVHEARLAITERLLAHGQAPGWDNFIMPIEQIDQQVEDLFSALVPLAYESDQGGSVIDACHATLQAYRQDKAALEPLFEAYRRVDASSLDTTQRKVLTAILSSYRQSGAGLAGELRVPFERTQSAIDALEKQFLQNLDDARQAWSLLISEPRRLAGIPESELDRWAANAAARNLEGWSLDLREASVTAVLEYAHDRALREQVYRAATTLASSLGDQPVLDNAPVLQALVRLRQERAQLRGFANAAEASLETKVAESTEQVVRLLETLIEHSRAVMTPIAQGIEALASELGYEQLRPWDHAFLARRLRERDTGDPEQQMRDYFALDRILEKLFRFCEQLFDLQFVSIAAHAWHEEVQLLEVRRQGVTLGHVYVDPYDRPGKLPWPYAFAIRTRHVDSQGNVTLAAAWLNCCFARPDAGGPTLLGHLDLCKLFHEFGHCLHQLVMGSDHRRLNSIERLGTDGSELIGKLLEQWCWSAKTLQSLSAHVADGRQADLARIERWLQARRAQRHWTLARDLKLAWFDFELHRLPAAPRQLQRLASAASQRTSVFPDDPSDRFAERFDYLVTGYDAGYYCYLWAEVHAVDIFERFEQAQGDAKALGRRLLEEIFAPGGARSMSASFEAFQGRPLSMRAWSERHARS